MLPRPKAQARIEHNDGLSALPTAFTPGWANQQSSADLNRLEMALPTFCPILSPQACQRRFAGCNLKAGAENFRNTRLQRLELLAFRTRRKVNFDHRSAGFDIQKRGSGLAKDISQRLAGRHAFVTPVLENHKDGTA